MSHAYDARLDSPFSKGDRVQLHPALDAWMMGDHYGTVVFVGRKLVHVLCDRSNKVRKIHALNLDHVN